LPQLPLGIFRFKAKAGGFMMRLEHFHNNYRV
jgi:hypothetical protein